MVGVTRMELIACEKRRELTFRGRVKGMKNKAYELSTLCGLDIGMIICSPSGQIETLSWPNQEDDDGGKLLLDLIARYKNQHGNKSNKTPISNKKKETQKAAACESELDVRSEKESSESVGMCLDTKIERVKARIEHLKKQEQPQAADDESFIQDYEIMDGDGLALFLNDVMDQPLTPVHEDSSNPWPHKLASATTDASNIYTSCHLNIPSVMTTGGYPMIGRAAFQDFTYNDESQYTNYYGDELSYNSYPWRTTY